MSLIQQVGMWKPTGYVPSICDYADCIGCFESMYWKTDVDGVYEWTNLVDSTNHLVQSTGSAKPAVTSNKFASGVDGLLGSAGDSLDFESDIVIGDADDISIFVVMWEATGSPSFPRMFEGCDNATCTASADIFLNDSTNGMRVAYSGGTHTLISSFPDETEVLAELHRDDSSGNFYGYLDGTLNTTTTGHGGESWPTLQQAVVNGFYIGGIYIYNAVHRNDARATSIRSYIDTLYTIPGL
jgi:hypothetical protein